MNSNEKVQWYNNPSIITFALIGMIFLIILSSQSYVAGVNALKLVQNILNHNITYMIVLIYFLSLHTKTGKKYFDYSNVLMIIFLFIILITSLLTLFQSFSLQALVTVFSNFLIFIYFFHTFLRGTRFWKEFHLNKSLFNEFSNDDYFYFIVIIRVVLFTLGLILIDTVEGTFLATFDFIYVILLARYIYLYGEYLNSINKNCNKAGGLDAFCEKVSDVAVDVSNAVKSSIDNDLANDDTKPVKKGDK